MSETQLKDMEWTGMNDLDDNLEPNLCNNTQFSKSITISKKSLDSKVFTSYLSI